MRIAIPDIVVTWQFWLSAVIVYIICEIFKQIPLIKQGNCGWLVNLFGIIIGAIILCLLMGFTWENAIFGVLSSAVSTLAYEIWSNILKQVTGGKVDYDLHVGGSD